jgi:hypothetical protein
MKPLNTQLSLSLFMPRISAYHPKHTFSLHYLAVLAPFFYG